MSTFAGAGGFSAGLSSGFLSAGLSVSTDGALGVVARRQRRLHRLAQRHGDQLRRVRVGPGVVERAVDRVELAIARVEEIRPLGFEDRLRVVEVPGRRLVERAALGVVQENRVVAGRGRTRVGQPARVGRPREAERLEPVVRDPVRALVHLGHLPRRIVVDTDAHRLVDERELLAVGRPLWRVAEAWPERGHLAFGAGRFGRAQRQLVFAAPIAPVGERLAVGRPARVPIGNPGGARHVDRRPVLGRDRDDVAARLEGGSACRSATRTRRRRDCRPWPSARAASMHR